MKSISNKTLKTLGWKITDDLPNLSKSVFVFSPHTNFWDGFYCKLLLIQYDINYKFLSKKEFFYFPLKYIIAQFPFPKTRNILMRLFRYLIKTGTYTSSFLQKNNLQKLIVEKKVLLYGI